MRGHRLRDLPRLFACGRCMASAAGTRASDMLGRIVRRRTPGHATKEILKVIARYYSNRGVSSVSLGVPQI
jgi:hypothetical protein